MQKKLRKNENMKLFCVLAVHNEQKYLPYTLESLKKLDCPVVVVLDRCLDSSENLIKRHIQKVKFVFKDVSHWKNSCAEAKSLGCDIAKKLGANLILITDADISLDVEAIQKAKRILESSKYDIIVLPYKQYSLYGSFMSRISNQIQNLFTSINRKLRMQPIRFGIYIGKANSINLEDFVSEYDVLQQKVSTTWIQSKNLHLRPKLDIASQIKRGIARQQLPQYTWLKMLISSLFTFQPFTLVGYFKGKTKK